MRRDRELMVADKMCKRPWLRSILFLGMIDLDLQGQIKLESQILPPFELVRPITHHPFKLESPNLDRKYILGLLRFLLILDLIGFDIHYYFQSWNRFFYQIYLRSFCMIFSETRRLYLLVKPSLAIDRISLGFWLNISFVVNYRVAFRSIVAIAIDLLTSEDRYFLWIIAVPLPRRCLQSQQHSISRMRGVTIVLSGPPNLRPESVVFVQTQLQYI